MNRRAAVSLVSLIVLLVFLLGLALRKLDQEHAERLRYQAGLEASQQSIVSKLTDVFTKELLQEQVKLEQGLTPDTRIQTIIDQLHGIDPALIKEAVQQAMKNVASTTTTTTTARPGTTTTTARPTTTTTGRPVTTTTTAPPPTTTTTRPRGKPPTTTTTRCLVNVAGIIKLC